jgi:hypothetical protein
MPNKGTMLYTWGKIVFSSPSNHSAPSECLPTEDLLLEAFQSSVAGLLLPEPWHLSPGFHQKKKKKEG